MKTKIISVLMSILFLIQIGCSNSSDEPTPADDPEETVEAPSLTFSAGTDSFKGVIGSPENGSYQNSIKVNSPGGFQNLEIIKIVDGQEIKYLTINLADVQVLTKEQIQYDFQYILTESDIDHEVSFKAFAIDQEGNESDNYAFGELQVRNPMLYFNTSLGTAIPADMSGTNTPNYLILKDKNTASADLGDVVTDNLSGNVNMIFSVNPDIGYYLTSPNACIETSLLYKFNTFNVLKIKAVDLSEESFSKIDMYDAWELESVYAQTEFGSNEERMLVTGAKKTLLFETQDGVIARSSCMKPRVDVVGTMNSCR